MKNLFFVMLVAMVSLMACQQSKDMMTKADVNALLKTQADSIIAAKDAECTSKITDAKKSADRAINKISSENAGLKAQLDENKITLKQNESGFQRKGLNNTSSSGSSGGFKRK